MGTFSEIGDYPGRGVLVRRRSDGDLEWAYFVTGRSESSRRRRARQVGDIVYIEPTGAGQADPLRHYACARPFSKGLIVGNGDHVEVLAAQLDDGVRLEAALPTINPEPDPPINTPRIGAVIRQRSAVIFSVAAIQGAIERRTTELPTTPPNLAVQTTYAGPLEAPIGSAPFSSSRATSRSNDSSTTCGRDSRPISGCCFSWAPAVRFPAVGSSTRTRSRSGLETTPGPAGSSLRLAGQGAT